MRFYARGRLRAGLEIGESWGVVVGESVLESLVKGRVLSSALELSIVQIGRWKTYRSFTRVRHERQIEYLWVWGRRSSATTRRHAASHPQLSILKILREVFCEWLRLMSGQKRVPVWSARALESHHRTLCESFGKPSSSARIGHLKSFPSSKERTKHHTSRTCGWVAGDARPGPLRRRRILQ